MHDRQHQGDVGAGQRLDEPVGGLGRRGADGVEHHHLGPVGPRLFDGRPQVPVGQLGVGSPQDDQLRVADLQRVEALGRAERHLHPSTDCWSADRSEHPGGTEAIPEPLGESHRQQALVPSVAVGHERLGAVAIDDLVEARSDLGERFVPGDSFEASFTFRADPAQRMQHALVAVHAVEELVDLRAQLALAVRMIGVAAHLQSDRRRPGTVDRDVPSAGVGTVVVTAAADDLSSGSGWGAHGPTLDACRRFNSSKLWCPTG